MLFSISHYIRVHTSIFILHSREGSMNVCMHDGRVTAVNEGIIMGALNPNP